MNKVTIILIAVVSIIVFSIGIPYVVIPEVNSIRVYEGISNISTEQLADAMPHMCVDCLIVINTTSNCNVTVNYSFVSENDYPYLVSHPQEGGAKAGSYIASIGMWGLISVLGSMIGLIVISIIVLVIISVAKWIKERVKQRV